MVPPRVSTVRRSTSVLIVTSCADASVVVPGTAAGDADVDAGTVAPGTLPSAGVATVDDEATAAAGCGL